MIKLPFVARELHIFILRQLNIDHVHDVDISVPWSASSTCSGFVVALLLKYERHTNLL